jgi:CDGSH-type Zn-finger protein
VGECSPQASGSSAGYIRTVNEVTIKARANGPYKIEGPVRVIDAEGREFVLPEGEAIALCRCGHSRTKPFCDKSHRRVGFVADDCAARVGVVGSG